MFENNLIQKLGIVILNYNDYLLTKDMVNALLCDNYLCKAKIVIVDNVSTNDSFEKLKDEFANKVDVIKSEFNGGYAYGNNFGIKFLLREYSNIEFIAVCNPDTIIFSDSVESMLRVLNGKENVKLVGCKAVDTSNNVARYCWKMPTAWYEILSSEVIINKLFLGRKLEYSSDELSVDMTFVDIVLGAFFIAKADDLKQIGYLDEDTFLYCEEQILSKKIKQKNGDIVVLNHCVYVHDHKSTSFRKQVESYRLHQKSKKVFLEKYTEFTCFKRVMFGLLTLVGTIERKIMSIFLR